MNRTNIFFGESHSDWLPVRGGESGDFVFRRGDGHAFAKIAPASRRGELAGERDRLIWLKGRGVDCPEVINWQEEQEGACLVITARSQKSKNPDNLRQVWRLRRRLPGPT